MMRWFEEKAEAPTAPYDPRLDMLPFFAIGHLPEHLQAASRPFAELAGWMAKNIPPSAEATMALRKLLEAKDCAVRAALLVREKN